ncbi:MAG: HEAT repeat domain-containing protein [Deltaproteobacteria bacterium]
MTSARETELSPAARGARVALYLLLLAAAAAALLVPPGSDPGSAEGRRPELLIAPVLLGLFAIGFVTYRFTLVRAGRYHAGKAFIQVGLIVLVLLLLVPVSVERWKASGATPAVDLTRQLRSPDPEARAMAAELVRHRDGADARRYVPRLVILLDDPAAEVRRQSRVSLAALAREDAGGDGPEASDRWRAYWSARGVAFPP